jgi:hypothetical protein
MACLLLTVAEVFTAISQSTPVCRDAVATNYVSGAPRTPHKQEHLWHSECPGSAENQPLLNLSGCLAWLQRRWQQREQRWRKLETAC